MQTVSDQLLMTIS